MQRLLAFFLLALCASGSFAQTNDDSVYTHVDHLPSYAGGLDSLHAFIKANVRYPQRATDAGLEGDVYISVIINKEGWIEHPEVVKSVYGALDTEALRIISMMPPWIPGTVKGNDVNTRCTIPISFRLAPKEQIYTYVEQMPTPTFDVPKYLASTLRYPEAARDSNISGRIIVKFVVDGHGDVQHVQSIRAIDPLLAKEAVRVVSQMPKWNPGRQNGKAVKTYYTLPVVFKLGNH